MEIFIDESGSFVSKNADQDSWCVVAAFTCIQKSKYRKSLENLKRRECVSQKNEIKLRQVSEKNYLDFLKDLYKAGAVLICVATDSGLNEDFFVNDHKNRLVMSLLNNIDEMKYETGKDGIKILADQIENIPSQLYIQMFCQIYLMHSFVNRGICYFVQRSSKSLKNFIWRVDQKSPDSKVDFEKAFEKICPAILQTISLREPGIGLKWCDYSHMEKYLY